MLENSLASDEVDLVAPTARLPSIRYIQNTSLTELHSCVEYLRFLYNPEVRGSRRRKVSILKVTNRPTSDRLSAIREDTFERSHAIRWLTSLVAHSNELTVHAPDSFDDTNDGNLACESLIGDAAALLAACAGTASSGHISRTYTFGPTPNGEQVSLTLMDAPLENGDYATVGAQTWGGACVMADILFENPEGFGLRIGQNSNEARLRVLELGAGTGLVGLAIAKLLDFRQIRADVVLTDFHPTVLANLRSNVAATFPPGAANCVNAIVVPLDWSAYSSIEATETLDMFDLVVGADIVYELEHALWIRSCLEKLLRLDAQFHLVIPLRRTHTVESSTVEQVFGETSAMCKFKILHREHFSCEPYAEVGLRVSDHREEVDYAYFQIGWKAGVYAERT